MNKIPLYVLKSFLEATPEEIEEVCNGCGSKDGMKVFDTMFFLDILIACQIHDWMFEKGKTLGDFFFANAMFIFNLIALILNGSNWFTVLPRIRSAVAYFLGVMTDKGREAYWIDKEINEDITISYEGLFKIKD